MKICPSCQSSYGDTVEVCSLDGFALVAGILEPGAVLRQKYQITGILGFGGMAVVYRARHLLWNEDRAVKVLLQPGSGFLAEAQILRRVEHPNIVRVEDADIAEDGRPFVAMEFVEGESLRDRLRRAGTIDPSEALRIAAETCSALQAAHSSGIIHRDIKPHNLLLARGPDGQEAVKVIDFGIAKVREEAGLGFTGVLAGTTGYFVGTLDYASPEQALGRPSSELDCRTDLYSLGLVLHEMLTGVLPFRGETAMAALLQRLQQVPAPLRQIKPDLPEAACAVVMRTLEREREARYSSASEMQRACEDARESIRREREEAIRRAEEAQAKRIAAEQKRQEREERRRQAVERLRSAVRSRSVVVRGLLARRAVFVALMAIGVLAVLGLGVFTYFYATYARVVDQKLRAGVFANTTRLFAAPESLAVGDVTSLSEIAAGLRRSGYNESRGNLVGSYQITQNSISIFPGRDSYFDQEPGVVKFAGGRISQIISLRDNTLRSQYQLEPPLITNLTDASREKRRIVKFPDTPPVLVQAVTAAEDKRFFQHSGFDPFGGPTITQKLVDLLWGPQSRLSRAIITLEVEQKLSKEVIFEDYANQVDLGARGSFHIRGFGQAAETYLGKDLSQITLPEAAQLAGMPLSPADLDPFRHPDRLRERRNEVLGLMRANGNIGDRDFALAIEAPLTVARAATQSVEAPYFVDLVNDFLESKFQDENFQSNAFRVYTTLDMRLQRAASEAIRLGMQNVDEQISKQSRFKGQTPPEPQAALVAIDPHTGAVKALVGGRNYGLSQLDHILAKRPPGSIFQPFVYAAALDTAIKGGPRILTPSTIVLDEPTTFWYDGRSYEPGDFDKTFRGKITLREALAHSLNIPAVKVAEMVGYDAVVDMANRAGMNYKLHPTPSVALGAYDITPLEAAAAYSMFANQGHYVKPDFLTQVRAPDGKTPYQEKLETKQVLDPRVAYLMTSLMEEVLRSGVASDVRTRYGFNVPAAAATGSSRDGWFAGYTSELLCLVWVGFEDNRDLDLEGARSAAPIWMEFMKRALQYREYRDTKPFAGPDGIVSIDIDPLSGMPATTACPKTRKEVYIAGTQPVGTCPLHGGARKGNASVAGWDTPSSGRTARPPSDTPPRIAGSSGDGVVAPGAATRARRQESPDADAAAKQQVPGQPSQEGQKGFLNRLKGIFKNEGGPAKATEKK
ncbi:MAG: transglycosylase domain-containing protein [Acidobacteriia bacterium]|nr:transglycosylase domain-containing protein [Terriglobia bacterium]